MGLRETEERIQCSASGSILEDATYKHMEYSPLAACNLSWIINTIKLYVYVIIYWSVFSFYSELSFSTPCGIACSSFSFLSLVQKNEHETLMVLTISRVFTQHFRQYRFEAENSLGREEFYITLVRSKSEFIYKYQDIHELDSVSFHTFTDDSLFFFLF